MGEPDSTTVTDLMQSVALTALDPNHRMPVGLLRKSGLHRQVLQSFYDALAPEITRFTGWNNLSSFYYSAPRDSTSRDDKKAEEATERWRKELKELLVHDEPATLIFDGELKRPPAPDFRVFVLRDGRLLFYNGGLYTEDWKRTPPVCGEVVKVLDAIDGWYPNRFNGISTEPFIILMTSLSRAFGASISNQERRLSERQALKSRLDSIIDGFKEGGV